MLLMVDTFLYGAAAGSGHYIEECEGFTLLADSQLSLS
jgi:hypothetical protein